MPKKAFILILTVGLISAILGATTAWFHDMGISRGNVIQAGVWGHDVAVINVTPRKTLVGKGYSAPINVTVENQGNYTETFDVTVYYNSSLINTTSGTLTNPYTTSLPADSSTTITFVWNTTGVTKYINYTLSAEASQVPSETDIADNTCIDGTVLVVTPGDVNADGIVNIIDAAGISAHWYPGPPIGPLGYDPNFDINCDGAVDLLDAAIVSAYWTGPPKGPLAP